MSPFVLAEVQLVPDLTMFIHIALILLMIWFLNRTFFKPINRILDARERNKGGRGGEAEGILREVSEKEAEYNAGLLEARNEGYELTEKERVTAVEKKNAEVAAVKTEVAGYLEKELSELDRQTREAEENIRVEAEKMADKISANILKAA
ncbi:MAG: ATP synthase F0 subunit B [Acidobacteriota bacterium]|nr:MAG: ATP synthase F0 subunit B [Acidobacteriota bacterium]